MRAEHGPVVVVVGPTAVGKSQVAMRVAAALGTEVLTADSRQVYRGMDVGTEKPTLEERGDVPHRLIDLVDPDERFNVGSYRLLALEEIRRLHSSGRPALIVGGTGLYVRGLLRGLWDGPAADWALRSQLMQEARSKGTGYLHRELARVDPELASRVHPHDEVKIIRGLEVYRLVGRPLSEMHRSHASGEQNFSAVVIGLSRERSELYKRIDDRVELQLAKGLVEETRGLLERGYGRDLSSMKGLGYRQICGFLAGEYDYDEAMRRLKRDTRHFAKRQATWFRREPSVRWLDIDERESPDHVAKRVLDVVRDYLTEPGEQSDRGQPGPGTSSSLPAAG